MHRTVTLTVKSKDLGKVLSSLEMSKDFEENTTLTLSIDIEDTKKNYQVLCGSPEVLEWDFIEEDKTEDEMKESVNPVTDIEEAIKTVCENTEIDIPSGMIEVEIDNMVKDIEGRLSYQGLKLEQYLQMVGKTEEDMRKEFEDQAKKSVKSRLVLEAVVKAEKLEASEEEVGEKIKEMAKQYNRPEDELLANEQLRSYIAESMKTEKAIEFIVKNAKIK